MIVSFGYAAGSPPAAQKIFDVRDLPHRLSDPAVTAKVAEMQQYVQAHPRETVAIGCQQGRHRAPALADQIATATKQSVWHRET